MCLRIVIRKNMKKNFFCILNVTEERNRIRSRIRIRYSEVGIRIRTKMSRIPSIGGNGKDPAYFYCSF
jgi:hypothetical protein